MHISTGQHSLGGNELEGNKKTVSVPETAKLLGIGRGPAYEAVRRGEIPHLRIGKRILVPLAALERMLAEAGRGA